jgi:sortase A
MSAMKDNYQSLSRGMLIVGALLILAGLGWGIWMRVNAPPPPVVGDAGAVVLAVTAPVRPTDVVPTVTPTPTPTATATPTATPTPTLVEHTAETTSVTETPTSEPTPTLTPTATPTATPTPTPTITPTPTPTRPPKAEKPPTRVVAPAIDMDVPVVEMGWEMTNRNGTMISEWIVPSKAAGWHRNSALPGAGDNVVLSGHHNIAGKVFRYVVDLEIGDRVTAYVDDVAYDYIVTEKYILKETGMPLDVRRKNAQWIMPTGDERLTLVTCWPYEWPGNSHRVIVVARPPGYFDSLQVDNAE